MEYHSLLCYSLQRHPKKKVYSAVYVSLTWDLSFGYINKHSQENDKHYCNIVTTQHNERINTNIIITSNQKNKARNKDKHCCDNQFCEVGALESERQSESETGSVEMYLLKL